MRYVIFDTETTGLSAEDDRIFEIGLVEVNNNVIGRKKQWYLNPGREISNETIEICKIDPEILKDKPIFASIAKEFLNFLHINAEGKEEETVLVAHNIKFDLDFLNAELSRCKMQQISGFKMVDTVRLVKARFPRNSASLDSACKLLEINLEERDVLGHGALRDSELLVEVFFKLLEGQPNNYLDTFNKRTTDFVGFVKRDAPLVVRNLYTPCVEELEEHAKLLQTIKLESIW